MNRIPSALLLLALLVSISCREEAPSAGSPSSTDWRSLFDGESLAGWRPKIRGEAWGEDREGVFRAADGVLRVDYPAGRAFEDRFGHLFRELPTDSYDIELECRFFGEQAPGGPGWARANSGLMIHCQSPETMKVDQSFPVSIEVQFLAATGPGPRPTANLCTPGTNVVRNGELFRPHCLDSSSKTVPLGDWVRIRVEVRGAESVRHFVEGVEVLAYEDTQLDPKDADAAALGRGEALPWSSGWIALQSESHPVEFRAIRWRPAAD